MIKEVASISPEDSAMDALHKLFEMKISGLPVIDQQGKLVGVFTEKEVLSYILPSYIEKVGRFIYEDDPKSTRKKFSEIASIKVSKIMRKELVTTSPETALSEVARIILTQRARRLPVLDSTGKVVGIVARVDVLQALAKQAEITLGDKKC